MNKADILFLQKEVRDSILIPHKRLNYIQSMYYGYDKYFVIFNLIWENDYTRYVSIIVSSYIMNKILDDNTGIIQCIYYKLALEEYYLKHFEYNHIRNSNRNECIRIENIIKEHINDKLCKLIYELQNKIDKTNKIIVDIIDHNQY